MPRFQPVCVKVYKKSESLKKTPPFFLYSQRMNENYITKLTPVFVIRRRQNQTKPKKKRKNFVEMKMLRHAKMNDDGYKRKAKKLGK